MSDAFRYALRLLSYRGRSTTELREKLGLKGFTVQQADEALQKLERLGYINDSALAGALTRLARDTRKLGRRGAMGYLLKRGISAGLAQEALAGYDEFEGAMRLALKKVKAMEGPAPGQRDEEKIPVGKDPVFKRRLYGVLARRGFSPQTIRQVFFKLEEEDT